MSLCIGSESSSTPMQTPAGEQHQHQQWGLGNRKNSDDRMTINSEPETEPHDAQRDCASTMHSMMSTWLETVVSTYSMLVATWLGVCRPPFLMRR